MNWLDKEFVWCDPEVSGWVCTTDKQIKAAAAKKTEEYCRICEQKNKRNNSETRKVNIYKLGDAVFPFYAERERKYNRNMEDTGCGG